MIDLATAALIAKTASDAVGAFDKIYRGYMDVLMKKRSGTIPPPGRVYVDSPKQKAFVAQSRSSGEPFQKVTYDELCSKLKENDLQYIKTLSRAMENYERQWNSAYEERSLASGMDIGRFDSQLEYLARQIADPLVKVLDFVQRMGLYLDDHYISAREKSREYLRQGE